MLHAKLLAKFLYLKLWKSGKKNTTFCTVKHTVQCQTSIAVRVCVGCWHSCIGKRSPLDLNLVISDQYGWQSTKCHPPTTHFRLLLEQDTVSNIVAWPRVTFPSPSLFFSARLNIKTVKHNTVVLCAAMSTIKSYFKCLKPTPGKLSQILHTPDLVILFQVLK